MGRDLDEKTFNDIDQRIKRSARKHAYKFTNSNRDVDDLYQDFWIQILEYEKEHGEWPLDFIEKICLNRVVDLIRYDEMRNSYSLDASEDEDERNSYRVDKSYDLATQVELDDLIDQFPKGSIERKYIEFYAESAGIRMSNGMTPPETRTQSGYTDSNLATMLGFKGTNDQKWVNFRNHMREVIADYVGRSLQELT